MKIKTQSLNKWEEFYKNTPLDKIPWQATQSDYLSKVIDSGKIKPGTAIDLGCGTGVKSVLLASRGFDVIGIDISNSAIKHAENNATAAGVKINFIVANATDLSFLKNKKFDLILDWANLHGIPESQRRKYVEGIAMHSPKAGKLILRCFGRESSESASVIDSVGIITLFTVEDIKKIYGKYFKILETNISRSSSKKAPSKFFYEFLMERL